MITNHNVEFTDNLTLNALIIGVLLLLSAILAAAETAIMAASKPRMLTLAQNGSRRAALVNSLWEKRELLVSAILVGNSIANIVSSTITTAVMIDLFGEKGVAYASAIMTVLIILFVEILPKTIALARADDCALVLAPFVRAVIFILGPITRLGQYIVAIFLKPFRLSRKEQDDDVAEEEIRGVIDMHADMFDGNEQTADMLHAIVDLSDMKVEDVMLHRADMHAVPIGQPTEKLVQDLLDAKHSLVPLWGKSPEDIVGVLDVRKLLAELARHKGQIGGFEIGNIVSTPWFIPNSTGLLDQLKAFREQHMNLAFVVDEYGVLQGMITLADILEEIVGHYDRGQFNAVNVPKAQADGSFILDGRFPIRELNREMDWDLPDEDATTVAGFVLHLAERIPEAGERFSYKNFSFEVMARKKLSLAKVRVLKTKSEDGIPAKPHEAPAS